MESLYASIPGLTQIKTVSVANNHTAQLANATIQCIGSTLEVGDPIEIDIGYTDSHGIIFTGYVKMIEEEAISHGLTVTASDVLIKAADYFIVANSPSTTLKVQNISPEDIIAQLLAIVDITDFEYDSSSYVWGVSGPIEISLISIYDYCKMLTDMIAWGFWSDIDGTVNFKDRRPYPMGGDPVVGTIANTDVISIKEWKNDRNIRNKVVVWGSTGIYAEAHADSPYLPADFYKTAVVSAPGIIDTQSMAQSVADFNLTLYNRLTQGITCTVIGSYLYNARKVIHLNYTAEDLYIYSAEHNWSSSGYLVNMELRKE